ADHRRGALVGFIPVGSVGHQATSHDKFSTTVNRRQVMFCREADDLFLIREEKRALHQDESGATCFNCLLEHTLESVGASYLYGNELQTNFSCRQLAFFP